ncbi:SsgA family sporulation/cell division regulator [Kitasatospora sp. NPDC088391]|uniref:SsgA family sporulation/cell division regulator n=1 Tax=Kitasatospora sp. NPDC088391 TaxID=3364074 RepID=UPI0038168049
MTEDEDLVPPQRSASTKLTFYLVLDVVVAPGLDVPVAASLRYSAAEPFVVHLDNHVDLPDPVTWALSRDLLLAGLEHPVGLGDLAVRPGRGPDAGSILLALRGEEEDALLRLPEPALRRFLRRTECVVPVGCETEHLDLNALVARLLDRDP